MHWQGLTDLTGASYTPIALVNADPAGVQVAADSPYKSVNELVAAIKANPGKFKASGTGQGGIWHLAIAGMLQDLKVDPASVPWVPSGGAAPGLLDLVAGGVQIAPVSLPEARAMIDAGKVKSLAVMADKPAALYPNVPTLKAATGSNWTMAAWRGIAAPKNLPPEARDKLVAALQKIVASKDYTDFMAQAGLRRDLRGARRFRQVHGQVGRRSRRDDEGGRHRQMTRSFRCGPGCTGRDGAALRPAPGADCGVKLNDAVWGALLLLLAAAVLVHVQAFGTIPGQKYGPAIFPGLVACGIAICAVLLIFNGLAARTANGARERVGDARALDAFAPARASPSRSRSASTSSTFCLVDRLGFIPTGVIYLAALFAVFGVRLGLDPAARAPADAGDPHRLLQAAQGPAALGHAAGLHLVARDGDRSR